MVTLSKSKFAMLSLLCAITVVTVQPAAHAQTGYSIPATSFAKVKTATCGFYTSKWLPGYKLKTGYFLPMSDKIAALKAQIKLKKTSTAKKLILKAQVLKLTLLKKAQTKLCNTLPKSGPSVVATPLPNSTTSDWQTSATPLIGTIGAEYQYFCPPNPGGSYQPVYGNDVYTSDSGICAAAVHEGLFEQALGGNVRFKVIAGQDLYRGSVNNGIETSTYSTSWVASFVFEDLSTGVEYHNHPTPTITWSTSTGAYNAFTESTFTFICPASGSVDSIWGTDRYTYDSSICTAAVHAGKISLKNGGTVTVQIKLDAGSYAGSTRNGVTSSSYGAWSGSFIFVN